MPARLELEEKIRHLLLYLYRSLEDFIPQNVQRIDDLKEALHRVTVNRLETEKVHLEGLFYQLTALSPLAVLKRGYSITTLFETQKVLFGTQGLKKGDRVKTKLSQGAFVSEVQEIESPKDKN